MTASRIARILAVAIPPAMIVGCGDSRIIIDDWGTSGYARIEGRVTRSNGALLANGVVFILCGPDSPGDFGRLVSIDATGRYTIDINAPSPLVIPASGTLICRLSAAPHNAPTLFSVERSVPFSATEEARPVTVIDLTEP